MNNIKNTWKGIKSIITIKNLFSDIPKSLSSNGSTITNQVEISNVFNNYFATIAEKTKENINPSHKHFSHFLKNRHHNSFFLSPTSKSEILSIISSLNSNKSVGPNSITIKILKLLKNDISSQLADIFNISFSTGVFPTILKVAKVVPVYKKDSKLDFSNYRPISLLPNIEKILEKLMYNRVYNFFTKNNLIYPLQFGFRQQYSTFHALISLTEDIRKNLDKGNVGCGIFVDLQKAFDTVEHDILLAKLEHYGILGISNEWFKSYLFDRKQFVSINGHVSNKASVKYGVPQSSVLGPLLFLIYINDLNHAIKFCKVHHFADDTNLVHFSKSANKLNKYINTDMKNLTNWLNANKISLNIKKTELVIFKHMNKKLEYPIKIKLSRKRLYPSKSVKYLGLKIDENLDWKVQTHDIATKLNRANVLLYKIRNYVSFNTLKAIYFAIFDSHINYANLIWGQNPNSKLRVTTLQKKALRIINNQPKNSHSGPLFKQNNILKFEDKILIGNIIFVSKSINNLLPPIFKNWFIFCSEIHNYNTVSSSTDKLFKPSYRTDSYGKNSVIISAINCWNKTQNILDGQSLKSLYPSKIKNILTKRCINKYQ